MTPNSNATLESRRLSIRRLPIIQQSETAECGLASLAMIMNYYGYEIDMASLRRENRVSMQGSTMADIVKIASKYNLEARGVKVELEHVDELDLPCILHWDMNHFVVLKSWKNGRGVIHDPAFGEKIVTTDELDKHFTGVALELFPSQKFKPEKRKTQIKLSYFFKNVPGLFGILLQLFIFALVLQICLIVTPLYMQWVTDEVLVSYDKNLLLVLAIGFLMLLFFQVSVTVLKNYISLYLSSRISLRLSSNVLTHLLQLPMTYFETRHMGDLQSRFGSTDPIQQFVCEQLTDILLNILIVIAMIIMMFVYNATLAFIVLLAVVIYILIRTIMYFRFKQINYDLTIFKAKRESHFMESMRSMQALKLYDKENDRRTAWTNKATDTINMDIARRKMIITYDAGSRLTFGIENILIIALGALAIMDGYISIGILLAFISYKDQFEQAAKSLVEEIIQYRLLSIHLDRLSDILLTEKDLRLTGDDDFSNATPDGSLKVNNISFKYKEDIPYILENISMEANPGEIVAIVGPSGCGKTTLMKVLLGLLYAESGEIFLGAFNQRYLGTRKYRSFIATVMQDDQLLSGSIIENIAFFDQNPDMKRVFMSAHLANIDKDIASMPMQFNTLVGDMGTTLSGGQKQRLLIARAIYKQPKYLFLDESTSHLDPESEGIVNKNLKDLKLTTIQIAHRRETISSADRVLKLKDGKLTDVTTEYITH